MWLDIWAFAEMIKWKFFAGEDVFKIVGQIVLSAVCGLLVAGWLLVAHNLWILLLVLTGALAAVGQCIYLTGKLKH